MVLNNNTKICFTVYILLISILNEFYNDSFKKINFYKFTQKSAKINISFYHNFNTGAAVVTFRVASFINVMVDVLVNGFLKLVNEIKIIILKLLIITILKCFFKGKVTFFNTFLKY